MLNNVILMGRLTKDIELKNIGDKTMARFTLAVQRNFKNADGNYDADFVSCQAWNGTAEYFSKFFKKGDLAIIKGSVRTGKYTEDDGTVHYTTDINVDGFEFCYNDSKATSSNDEQETAPNDSQPDELPF